jgi:hypothetical protein
VGYYDLCRARGDRGRLVSRTSSGARFQRGAQDGASRASADDAANRHTAAVTFTRSCGSDTVEGAEANAAAHTHAHAGTDCDADGRTDSAAFTVR